MTTETIAKAAIADLFKVTNKEDNFEVKNAKQVYEQNLPEGVTPEQAKAIGDYNKTFHKELVAAVTGPMVDHLKSTEGKSTLAQMEASVYGVKYNVALDVSGAEVALTGGASLTVGSHMMTAVKRTQKLWSN